MREAGELLAGLTSASLDANTGGLRVSGLHDDSRRVQAGGMFVALRGSAADGRAFVADAEARGARVIVGEDVSALAGSVADCNCTYVDVPDARRALAVMAMRWFDVDTSRGRGLTLLGVTGTNGKSTTTYMTAAILRSAGVRCAMLGTVQYDVCGTTVTAGMTTPGPLELAALLAEARRNGATAAVMEVSSHALDQRRTDGLRFTAAAFTNLTQDHLDYHGSLERYRAAKARLFRGLDADAVAILNADDPAYIEMRRGCAARVQTFAIDAAADLSARITRDSIEGTLYRMRLPAGELVLENALVGRHNVANALAAAGLALAAGANPPAIEAGLAGVRNIPGRLQRVLCRPGVEVFVDYAHTDDALQNVLSVLRPLTRRRLMVVFGCGGDRDRGKRPKMAAAAARWADAIIVTSDNPRTEDPLRIIEDIAAGFTAEDRRKVVLEPDRRCAIRAALAGAAPGDVLLIAGKGHESYQIVGRERLAFDDVAVALEAAGELLSPQQPQTSRA